MDYNSVCRNCVLNQRLAITTVSLIQYDLAFRNAQSSDQRTQYHNALGHIDTFKRQLVLTRKALIQVRKKDTEKIVDFTKGNWSVISHELRFGKYRYALAVVSMAGEEALANKRWRSKVASRLKEILGVDASDLERDRTYLDAMPRSTPVLCNYAEDLEGIVMLFETRMDRRLWKDRIAYFLQTTPIDTSRPTSIYGRSSILLTPADLRVSARGQGLFGEIEEIYLRKQAVDAIKQMSGPKSKHSQRDRSEVYKRDLMSFIESGLAIEQEPELGGDALEKALDSTLEELDASARTLESLDYPLDPLVLSPDYTLDRSRDYTLNHTDDGEMLETPQRRSRQLQPSPILKSRKRLTKNDKYRQYELLVRSSDDQERVSPRWSPKNIAKVGHAGEAANVTPQSARIRDVSDSETLAHDESRPASTESSTITPSTKVTDSVSTKRQSMDTPNKFRSMQTLLSESRELQSMIDTVYHGKLPEWHVLTGPMCEPPTIPPP
uniref:ARAD1A13024p n=1 Tax=Blastobotrys adeninivorans TaxID=409370 RepID=A0A060T338_BLAAD